MNRILAIVLALIIGSPNCWCCLSVRAMADAAPGASCCVPSADLSHSCPIKHDGGRTSGSGKSCPCDSAKAVREATGAAVIVPAVSSHFDAIWPLLVAWTDGLPFSFARDSVMSHGPPCRTGAIFARDCALRL